MEMEGELNSSWEAMRNNRCPPLTTEGMVSTTSLLISLKLSIGRRKAQFILHHKVSHCAKKIVLSTFLALLLALEGYSTRVGKMPHQLNFR